MTQDMFFFEKKNQKTLARCRGPIPNIYLIETKGFASFLRKSRPFLPLWLWIGCFWPSPDTAAIAFDALGAQC